ncbi:MAG: hypothetical protein ABSH36_10835 [Solirubrobacteraceae bacterium]
MGRTREGELSASTAAVLGLLIEQPDSKLGVERRLRGRLVAAQFSATTAHSAIKSLLGNRYICLYDGVPAPTRAANASAGGASALSLRPDLRVLGLPGTEPTPDREEDPTADGDAYHATPEGAIVFWRWLRTSSSISAIRDELRTKVAFSRPQDTPRMIELIESEEEECRVNYNTLHKSLAEFEEHIDAEAFVTGKDWSTLMLVGLIRDEAAIWFAKLTQRERLREYMEGLREESLRRLKESGQVP